MVNYYSGFIHKLIRKYSDMAKCRQVISQVTSNKHKLVSKADFRQLLVFKFNIALAEEEFDVIWSTLAQKLGLQSSVKTMSLDKIFSVISQDGFSPGDKGLSKIIVELNDVEGKNFESLHEKKDKLINENLTLLTSNFEIKDIVKTFREKLKSNFTSLRNAYDTLASYNNGYFVTMKNIGEYLKEQLFIDLNDEKLLEMYEQMSGKNRVVLY